MLYAIKYGLYTGCYLVWTGVWMAIYGLSEAYCDHSPQRLRGPSTPLNSRNWRARRHA